MDKQEHPINLWERIIWLAFAVLGCIGILVFLATTAQLYWQDAAATDFWNLATAVFTFFGVLLTAGAAFATVAAVISYFSVNQKLKEAKSSLKKFKQLDQERKQLQAELETMAAYQAVTQDLQQHDATDKQSKQKSLQVALQILANPQAGFEARLKARAIIQDDKIYREFEQVRAEPSEEAWQQIIAMRQENLAVWKLLFQAAAEAGEAYDKAKSNYATALFNYGSALLFYGYYLYNEGEKDKAVQRWQQAGVQFSQTLEIQSDNHGTANNWGIALMNEGKALSNLNNLKGARILWAQAREKYKLALEIKSDKYDAAGNWANVLNREAVALSESGDLTEARKLWEKAGEKYAEAIKIKQNNEIISNWGSSLTNEAQAVAKDGDLAEARKLWEQAGRKYIWALEVKQDTHNAVNRWLKTIKDEAKYLSDTDQIQLWKNAQNQVLKLQNHSPEHRQSELIRKLLDKISNAKVIAFPQKCTEWFRDNLFSG